MGATFEGIVAIERCGGEKVDEHCGDELSLLFRTAAPIVSGSFPKGCHMIDTSGEVRHAITSEK